MLAELTDSVVADLGIKRRKYSVAVSDKFQFACTELKWLHPGSIVRLSSDLLESHAIIRHEICHALLPTKSLLIAEGIAISQELKQEDRAGFYGKSERLSEYLSGQNRDFSIEQLAECTPRKPGLLDSNLLYLESGQTAHQVCHSFMNWYVEFFDGFAAQLQSLPKDPGSNILQEYSDCSYDDLQDTWLYYAS